MAASLRGAESCKNRLRYDAPVPKYPFLSDEWFAAARAARRRTRCRDPERSPPGDEPRRHQLTARLAERRRSAAPHRRRSDGHADWGPGHFDGADLTLTTDYDTARDIFVSGNPQSAMQAFMEGKVKLQGDLTRLMAAQAVGTGPGAPDLASALAEMTE